jgi:uncharacterized protein (TIGR00730 family)
MQLVKSVCVYCGSGLGRDPFHAQAAALLGRRLAENNVTLVYGGGSLGLMGTVAKSVLAHGGNVTGIIPRFLIEREGMLDDMGEDYIITHDMHERKRLMFEKADAFVALPGGVGTLEELVEQLTWTQLGQHHKPVLIANFNGYWEPLLAMLDHMQAHSFIREGLSVPYHVAQTVDEILPMLEEAAFEVLESGKHPKSSTLEEPLRSL